MSVNTFVDLPFLANITLVLKVKIHMLYFYVLCNGGFVYKAFAAIVANVRLLVGLVAFHVLVESSFRRYTFATHIASETITSNNHNAKSKQNTLKEV